MKGIIFILMLLSLGVYGQENQEKPPVPNTIYIELAEQGKVILDEGTEIQFVRVTNDSRCPKEVTCVWAGFVEVEMKINGYLSNYRLPAAEGMSVELFTDENYTYVIHEVLPYPAQPGETLDYKMIVQGVPIMK